MLRNTPIRAKSCWAAAGAATSCASRSGTAGSAFPNRSVGMTRQYCGQLGKQDNCQVAVSLSLANHEASLPIAYRLYLPEDWAKDQARRDKARVPRVPNQARDRL